MAPHPIHARRVQTPRGKSKVFDIVLDSAQDLFALGFIDARQMKAYEALMPSAIKPISAKRIQMLRKSLHVSQPVFAALLNTSESTVKQWEAGDKKPSGTSLKLLDLAQRKGVEVLL